MRDRGTVAQWSDLQKHYFDRAGRENHLLHRFNLASNTKRKRDLKWSTDSLVAAAANASKKIMTTTPVRCAKALGAVGHTYGQRQKILLKLPKLKRAKKMTKLQLFYEKCKESCGDAILFIRMGDFYECFYDDAKLASEALGLTLTSRDKRSENPVPMAGFPHHQLDKYIAKMIKSGHRVAVADSADAPLEIKEPEVKFEQATIAKYGKVFKVAPATHHCNEDIKISQSCIFYGRPEMNGREQEIYEIIMSNLPDEDDGDISLYSDPNRDSVAYWSALEIGQLESK